MDSFVIFVNVKYKTHSLRLFEEMKLVVVERL